jgi:glutamate-ammonia-ligase adenylyltransferase
MMHYRQTYTLPPEAGALDNLARRLGFDARDRFLARYQQHGAAIRAIYVRRLGNDEMKTRDLAPEQIQRHVARMDPSYAATFSDQEIRRHAVLADQLDVDCQVRVEAALVGQGNWRVTIVGYDYPGELSLICGLLFAYGFSIVDGSAFTYEPVPLSTSPRTGGEAGRGGERRKIVDVFTVQLVQGQVTAETWTRYADDLMALVQMMCAGQVHEAQGELAKRAASIFRDTPGAMTPLYPVDIEIDNDTSGHYTVLRIDAPDTVGFLYEFTNALALNRVYIARVLVDSTGHRAHDTLYVTDADGRKITAAHKQRELRAATVLIKHFTHLLPHSPDPASALLHFSEFIGELFARPGWPDELASLENPQVLGALAQVLGVSNFLWDDFLRMQHANLFPVVRDVDALTTAKSKEQLQAELEADLALEIPEVSKSVDENSLKPPSSAASTLAGDGAGSSFQTASRTSEVWRAALNDFKDREMFRVDMRHILGHAVEFWEFAEELTDLAQVVVDAAYRLCFEELCEQFGSPLLADGQPSPMTVLALGKCGGRELGFASDIELMFIYAGNGQTTGPRSITTSEFYEKLVEAFVRSIRAKREGIFEIDLQLRPYGKAGSLSVSLEAFRRYFAPQGPAWAYERQALVKLRPIAGDDELGRQVMALRDAFVYTGEPFDVTAMRAMRERQIRHLVTGGTFNAKFSPGGTVDVEYLVQGLQITYGHRHPALRLANTRAAMAALAEAGILSPDDYARLRRAHTFLRWLVDSLRVVRGNTRDLTVPPPESEEFAFLARRLRYGGDAARLRDELNRYIASVQEVSARLWAALVQPPH